MRTLLVAAGSTIALWGCASAPAEVAATNGAYVDPTLERLHVVYVQPQGLRIRAESNGCTTEDYFNVTAEPIGSSGSVASYLVRFERARPDNCSGHVTNGASLFFAREDIGLPENASITVANPVGRFGG